MLKVKILTFHYTLKVQVKLHVELPGLLRDYHNTQWPCLTRQQINIAEAGRRAKPNASTPETLQYSDSKHATKMKRRGSVAFGSQREPERTYASAPWRRTRSQKRHAVELRCRNNTPFFSGLDAMSSVCQACVLFTRGW